MSDAVFAALGRRYGRKGAVDLTGYTAFMVATDQNLSALAFPRPTDAEVDAMLAGGGVERPGRRSG